MPPAVTSRAPAASDRPISPAGVAGLVRGLRFAMVRAHEQVLRAQTALQLREFQVHGAFGATLPAPAATARVDTEARFKPLARTAVTELDGTALAQLAAGDIAAVFGSRYAQDGANPDIRLSGTSLAAVRGLDLYGGTRGRGGFTARVRATDHAAPEHDVVEAVVQCAQVFALYTGLHLCLADATFERSAPGLPDQPVVLDYAAPGGSDIELSLEVTEIDLVPRPYLRIDAEASIAGGAVGRVRGVTIAVVEKPGVPIGPELGGVPARWLGRVGRFGERALLSEFHLAHMCRGDQGIGMGPEFTPNSARKATRPPDGGLLLVDRFMEMTGTRGTLDGGSHRTEYDSPADSWYYLDTANASMPNCVYMETSLQAALLLGYYLGPTLADPEATVSLRNLGGTATVLREVDLRDKTIVEHSQLLSTSPVPGSILQNFAYTMTVDGEPFYSGDTLFGYFSDAAMANQNGLDAGRSVPTWLDDQPTAPATRTIDIAARRADPHARLVSRGHLALLDRVRVVDGGGRYGQGYLHAVQPIDPSHWVFARHFRYDPVIPGSFGIESCIQAMQEWVLDSGFAAGMTNPGFVLPVGLPFTWKYRGQFLPTDGEYTLEVHVKRVEQRPDRVRVVGEASMWKPGLRIYELSDIAVELRAEGALPW
ncbi:beta-ketoacyl synthase [Nocardia uniformis]|uniref:Beta-ketoacyl synthase n=2 Tax=Nocardia uniformis TaxID=53432 RepID=A0A849BQK3_9NOCA|nr:beta-ketoacyl synthase [Nocardia uniformis]